MKKAAHATLYLVTLIAFVWRRKNIIIIAVYLLAIVDEASAERAETLS